MYVCMYLPNKQDATQDTIFKQFNKFEIRVFQNWLPYHC